MVASVLVEMAIAAVFAGPDPVRHVLPLGDAKLAITQAAEKRFAPHRVITLVSDCKRLDTRPGRAAHAVQCRLRLYTMPDRTRWCGYGWAKRIGQADWIRSHALVAPCGTDGQPVWRPTKRGML